MLNDLLNNPLFLAVLIIVGSVAGVLIYALPRLGDK